MRKCAHCGSGLVRRKLECQNYWEKRQFCSTKCMGLAKRGVNAYERTVAHRVIMREAKKNSDYSIQSAVFKAINRSRKGLTLEQIYGNLRAHQIRMKSKKYGAANNNWRGGSAGIRYPKEYTLELRRRIRNRDQQTCQECGAQRDLTVHHIDYNKLNNAFINLITLCRRCNSLANSNREICQEKYRRLLGV